MSDKVKTKVKDFVPTQLKDPLFWRGCVFGIIFFSMFFSIHPTASAYIANIL